MKCKVHCLSCNEDTTALVIQFGDGYIGICTYCGKLAYNAKEKPQEEKANLREMLHQASRNRDWNLKRRE